MQPTIPLRKLVIELRYKPDLGFYSKMDEVALEFADQFPDWERSPLTVEIRDKRRHRRVFLAHRRCFYESDLTSQESISEFDAAIGILKRVCDKFSFSQLQRVGVRQWIAADIGTAFASMVDRIHSRFLSQSEELTGILNDKVTDVAYAVNFESNAGWKYHVRLGPMTNAEWFQRVPHEDNLYESPDTDDAETFEEYKSTIPGNLLYLDMDCYAENVSASELNDLITEFRRRSADVVGKLIRYCKE